MSTIVFLGGGRITSAMLAGLRLAATSHRMVVHDRNPGKLRDLKMRYAVAVESDLNSALKQADVLIVAVRPSSVREVIHAIGNVNRALLGRTATLAVSLAAGVPLRVYNTIAAPSAQLPPATPRPVCHTRPAAPPATLHPTSHPPHPHRLHNRIPNPSHP